MAVQTETREQEIRKIWWNYRLFYKLLGVAILVGIGILLGRLIYTADKVEEAWSYGVNIYTSVLSTIFTVGIIEVLSNTREKREAAAKEEADRQRDKRNAEEAQKRQLMDDVTSIITTVAVNAVQQMRRKELLTGENGLLKGENLRWAHLNGVDLSEAQLNSTDLRKARLNKADLRWTHLEGANLNGGRLNGANLNLAHLNGADLSGAQLNGADLSDTNLQDAKLAGTIFNETTKLPDGSLWTPETDMRRFTDFRYEGPNGEKFWRSDYPKSPAYRGDAKE